MRRRREVFVHTRHTRANITPTLAGAALLCLCAQARGQGGAQTQTFVIHGTPRTCTAITQLDSALLADCAQFFAGWTESDYADAVAWSQACAQYGWQVPWRPRIPLLMSQHDRALKPAQTQTVSSMATAGALPNPPAQARFCAAGCGTGSNRTERSGEGVRYRALLFKLLSRHPLRAYRTRRQLKSYRPWRPWRPWRQCYRVLPFKRLSLLQPKLRPVQRRLRLCRSQRRITWYPVPRFNPPLQRRFKRYRSRQRAVALPSRVRDHMVSDGQEDSFLTDSYFKEHFHRESLWVASKANLDIGDDRAPSAWSSNGKPAQMKNRLTADRIVLYCSKKTNSGESGKRPLLWDLRWCEAEEASAYNRLVSGNEFPTAGRAVVLGCAGVDSYVYLERCMATLTEAGMH